VYDRRDLFDFMVDRVKDVGVDSGLKSYQAFAKWFANTYFSHPQEFFSSDGSGDGKVDSFFQVNDGKEIRHVVLNTKFTQKYDAAAPVAFYDELIRFWQAFANKSNRASYLKTVRSELIKRYQNLFRHYDEGRAQLFFVTDHRRNEKQSQSVKATGVQIFHLDEVLQFVVDYIEDAMPRTPLLTLTGIGTVLSADKHDTKVPTSIVFAKVNDLIRYMEEEDPYDLLFARNIRLKLPNSKVNPEITKTFSEQPTEFVFSNNGITILCESHSYDPGTRELTIQNPRVVNGSQTLHSVREVAGPPASARVMLRIIQVPPPPPADFSTEATKRREIIEKISIRSNLQNPIKKWNLVSNDVFQHGLARFFRKKKLYYERRDGEWSQRQTELKSVGIRRGPRLKGLMQLIASYNWDKKMLGPVVAKRGFIELLEEDPYETIRKTPSTLVYQLYLLGEILDACISDLASSRKYVGELAAHANFALFSLLVRALQASGARFGEAKMTSLLEEGANPSREWLEFCKAAVDAIRVTYKEEARRYRNKGGKDLTLANFAKADYVGKMFKRPLPKRLRALGKRVLDT